MKNALPSGRALGLYSHTAEAYYNTDSVVYYDSTFSQKKQENDKSARFLAYILRARVEGKTSIRARYHVAIGN